MDITIVIYGRFLTIITADVGPWNMPAKITLLPPTAHVPRTDHLAHVEERMPPHHVLSAQLIPMVSFPSRETGTHSVIAVT